LLLLCPGLTMSTEGDNGQGVLRLHFDIVNTRDHSGLQLFLVNRGRQTVAHVY